MLGVLFIYEGEEILKNKLGSSVHPLPATQNNINNHLSGLQVSLYFLYFLYF